MIIKSKGPKPDWRHDIVKSCGIELADTQSGLQEQVDMLVALSFKKGDWFVRSSWHAIEAGPLAWNWHHSLIMDRLDYVATTEGAHELVICIPPGEMKSVLVSVMWPALIWLRDPTKRLLSFANSADLTIRDGLRMRQIITSEWYGLLQWYAKNAMGVRRWALSDEQNTKTHFANTAWGFRQNLGIGAAVTGKRGDIHIVDDPYDVKAAVLGSTQQINRRMTSVVEIYRSVLASRVNDDKRNARVTIMQRIHQLDLAGHLVRNGVECIVLPTEYDPHLAERLPGGQIRSLVHPHDPRSQVGELLNPSRRPIEIVQAMRKGMGAKAYGAQHGQRPTPAEGSIFRRPWFDKRYEERPKLMARRSDKIVMTIDCNFKKTSDGSLGVIQIWGESGHGASKRFALLDRIGGRWSWTELEGHSKRKITEWNVDEVVIENKANGPALIDSLTHGATRADGVPIAVIPFDPGTRDKVERVQLGSVPAYEAHQIDLPSEKHCPWIEEWVENHLAFPDGANDDDVDAESQYLIRARGLLRANPMEAVERAVGWMFGGVFSGR